MTITSTRRLIAIGRIYPRGATMYAMYASSEPLWFPRPDPKAEPEREPDDIERSKFLE